MSACNVRFAPIEDIGDITIMSFLRGGLRQVQACRISSHRRRSSALGSLTVRVCPPKSITARCDGLYASHFGTVLLLGLPVRAKAANDEPI